MRIGQLVNKALTMGLHPYMVESPSRMIGLIWAVPVKYGPELVVLCRPAGYQHRAKLKIYAPVRVYP